MSRFLMPLRPTLAVAGVILALSDVLEELNSGATFSAGARTLPWQAGAMLSLVGVVVLALALVAMHARQAEPSGRSGLIVAVVAGAGTALMAGVSWSTAFLDAAAARVVPAFLDNTPPPILVVGCFGSLAVFALGWALYAIVTLRSGVPARIPTVLVLIGALLSAVPFAPFSMALFGRKARRLVSLRRGAGAEARMGEDPPMVPTPSRVAQAEQFTLDSPVPPSWILPSQLDDQVFDLVADGWMARHMQLALDPLIRPANRTLQHLRGELDQPRTYLLDLLRSHATKPTTIHNGPPTDTPHT